MQLGEELNEGLSKCFQMPRKICECLLDHSYCGFRFGIYSSQNSELTVYAA